MSLIQGESEHGTVAGLPDGSVGKEYACNAGDPVRFLGQEDPLEMG